MSTMFTLSLAQRPPSYTKPHSDIYHFEKNAIHHTHIALHIRYLSLDSGDGLGLLGGGGVEVLGAGDFR